MDFSDILSESFEPAWRTFRFRSAEYAELFRESNAARLWNPTGAAAKAAKRKRERSENRWGLVAGVALAILVLWWLYDKIR
jgi:ferric-dicitrate binding protein FerR (iron transport regulator)